MPQRADTLKGPSVELSSEKHVCRFFVRGKCKYGHKCKYSHDNGNRKDGQTKSSSDGASMRQNDVSGPPSSVPSSQAEEHGIKGEKDRSFQTIETSTDDKHVQLRANNGEGAHTRRNKASIGHKVPQKPCFAWARKGECFKGDACRYAHDPQIREESLRTAAERKARKSCHSWNHSGKCAKGDTCPDLHDPKISEDILLSRERHKADEKARLRLAAAQERAAARRKEIAARHDADNRAWLVRRAMLYDGLPPSLIDAMSGLSL
ncbi:hypothetical protein FISHEDRAFT_62360 [Fistulina hepatica ATCC 64428]|nr:hypothetical protein FISHEDRAFT_62360 [Fistulina hepatica ATCC 64428]